MASVTGHASEQLQKLEELFVECKNPDKELREKWSKDLGMDPDQIKHWFKNKALLVKIEEKLQENDALRIENAKIQSENIMMSKRLENCPKCCACSGNEALEDLLRENAKLKEEHERVANILVGMLQDRPLLQLRGSAATSNDKFDD